MYDDKYIPLISGTIRHARANPLAMNVPPYFTLPADSSLLSEDQPCVSVKSHLRTILDLVADRYGPYTDLWMLAGNVIGAGGWCDLPTYVQHEYVNTKAGAFIASGMMYLEVSGVQACDVLNYLTPRDIASLKVGQAAFAVFTTHIGGIDEEALVLRIAEKCFLVSCGGGSAPSYLYEALDRFPHATVRNSEIVSFNIKGPGRFEVMAGLVDPKDRSAISELKPFRSRRCKTNAGEQVHVLRTIIGMEMWGSPNAITAAWREILDKPKKVLPCGWDLLDTYRVECEDIEFLLHPLDMNYATTLSDVGLDWMIAPEKTAEYVGRDALNTASIGNGLRLVKLCATKDRTKPPRIGEQVTSTRGSVCGYVTSTGFSYKMNSHLAFAHLSSVEEGSSEPPQLDGWIRYRIAMEQDNTRGYQHVDSS